MTNDLQKVSCYDSSKCKEIYNCAPATSIYSCSSLSPTSPPGTPACPAGQNHSYCFGSDPNYCSGIIQQCDPNSGYYCQPNISNPAVNYFSENLGCDVTKDASCMEFEKYIQCQDDCWDLGGSKEVENACGALFKDASSCNAMKYFCKWDSRDRVCTASNQDPWQNFLQMAPQNDGTPRSIFSENVNGQTLNCAQSSWSSTQVTSYADTIRTCCIGSGADKKCITTPRCQFVESTCDCGFKDLDFSKNPSYTQLSSISDPNSVKDPWFICEDTQQSLIVGNNTFLKKGYCTWCKGSQLHNFDYRNWRINNHSLTQGHNVRTSDAWGTSDSCNNRCSTYNKCENDKSEILWNECIWRHSNGTVGVDPTSPNLDLAKGFCYSDDCLQNATTPIQINKCNILSNLKNVCENELAKEVSTKNQLYPVTVNTDIPSERCTEGTLWNHSCTQSNNTTHAENYACGWCPNLQNDWPGNPCETTTPTSTSRPVVSANWFFPLSVIGVKNQNDGIVAVVLISVFSLLILIGFGFLIRWLRNLTRR